MGVVRVVFEVLGDVRRALAIHAANDDVHPREAARRQDEEEHPARRPEARRPEEVPEQDEREEAAEAAEKGKDFWEKAKDYVSDKVDDAKSAFQKKEETPGDSEAKDA